MSLHNEDNLFDTSSDFTDDDDNVENQNVESISFEDEDSPAATTTTTENDDDDNVSLFDHETDQVSTSSFSSAAVNAANLAMQYLSLKPNNNNNTKNPPKQLSILALTWNTESVLIAETLQRNGQEPVSFYSESWLGCKQPDFLPELFKKHIFEDEGSEHAQGKHHLIVVALQESAKPGDYLLSHAFGGQLGERYVLVKRGRMMGVGRTTLNAFRREGAVRTRGLRMAIYARKDFISFVHFQAEKAVLCTMQDYLTRGKGGYGIVLRVDGFGLMAFLNVHLPFVASTLRKGNHARQATGVRQQDDAFNNILKQFLHRQALHHLFVLGDLNYRVQNPANVVNAADLCAAMGQKEEFRKKIYLECDELRKSITSKNLPLAFEEGVDNNGPSFMPTAKMHHQRDSGSTVPGSYKFGTNNHRNPSWCDRILYLPGSLQKTPTISQLLAEALERNKDQDVTDDDLISSNSSAVCTYYDRFESGETMTNSDHSAVCAYYTINR